MIDYYETKSQPITKVMVWAAYKEVRSNRGGSGVDGMTWSVLDKDAKRHLYKLWNRMSSGSYFPPPVREVEIAKKDGGVRKLGIPTLLDRIAQQVVRKQLEPILEPLFHMSSYGYRPGRSAHDAVAQSQRNCFNHDFALDLDIKSYFDTIDHDLMMKALRHYCKERWILMYVERWLKADVLRGKERISRITGTPQGGVISPLLANLYLHVVFDQWMEKHHPEKPFERYADDIVVHCKTEKQAKYMRGKIGERMQTCKLQLHPEKTKIVNLRGVSVERYARSYDFLGFTLRPVQRKVGERMMLLPGTFVSNKSKTAIRKKFKEWEIHKRRKPLVELARELNPTIRGLIAYFHKFWNGGMRPVWNQLNHRLLKWVKWEKGLYKYASLRWLRGKYAENPTLFAHWKLVQP
jgi:group II intron reverse transcriptase/maturase